MRGGSGAAGQHEVTRRQKRDFPHRTAGSCKGLKELTPGLCRRPLWVLQRVCGWESEGTRPLSRLDLPATPTFLHLCAHPEFASVRRACLPLIGKP